MKNLFIIFGIIIILTMSAVPAFATMSTSPPLAYHLPAGGVPFTLSAGMTHYFQISEGWAYESNNPFIVHHVVGLFYRVDAINITPFTGIANVWNVWRWTGTDWTFHMNLNAQVQVVSVDNVPFDEYNLTTTTIVRANHDLNVLMLNHVPIDPVPVNPIVFFAGSSATPPPPPPPASIWDFGALFGNLRDILLSPLIAIRDGITNLPQIIGNLLRDLFIPSDDFFSNKFNGLRTTLSNRLSITAYENLLADFQSITAGEMPQIRAYVPLLNREVVFVDFQWIENAKPYYFPWVRGAMFILLILYNYNMVYKLIRGTDLAGATNTVNNMRGGR